MPRRTARRDAGLAARPGVLATSRSSGRSSRYDAVGTALRRLLRAGARRGRAAGRREGRRLVPGAHGVRSAGARQPQHPRRCAQSRDAEEDEPQDQVPGGIPAVCARPCSRRTSQDHFELDRPSPYMLLVVPVREEKRSARCPSDYNELQPVRPAVLPPLGSARDHARGLLGAHSDRQPGRQPALLAADPRVQAADRLRRASSTPASTCAASRSCARRRTRTAASCGPRWTAW